MMRNNRGFSLIELIVVVALMSILLGVSGYSLNLITSTRAKSTKDKLMTAIENTSEQALASGGGFLEIYRDTDGCLYVRQTITNGAKGGAQAIVNEKIGSSKISVVAQYVEGSSVQEVPVTGIGTSALKLEFNAGTGSFKGTVPKYIIVSGGNHTYKIRLYSLTGKVKLE